MTVEIIENAINPALLRACEAAWPETSWDGWHRYNGQTANKYGSLHHSLIPRACLVALDALAEVAAGHIGDSFIDYDLHAAGLHMTPPGGFLSRHLDAEFHPIKHWKRTYSIVLFLHDSPQGHGGQLRLEGRPDQQIYPIENTAVIFSTQDQWHEVCRYSEQAVRPRKTLALFAWQHGVVSGPTSANFSQKPKA